MTIKKLTLLLIAFAVLVTVLPSRAQENPEGWSGDLAWPREYSNEAGAKLLKDRDYRNETRLWCKRSD